MKTIVYSQNGNALYELDMPKPQPGERDLLVKIHAIGVNPMSTKVHRGAPTD